MTAFHDRRPGVPPLASPRRDPTTLSRVDAAYRQLRAAIISGEYPPGAPLRHSELADAFGVSLIPIREAMRRLEVERLVESIPNKGTRVAPVSIEDVQDVYATRVLLEVEALRRAWPRLDAAAVGEVRALCDSMVERVRRSDRQGLRPASSGALRPLRALWIPVAAAHDRDRVEPHGAVSTPGGEDP